MPSKNKKKRFLKYDINTNFFLIDLKFKTNYLYIFIIKISLNSIIILTKSSLRIC